MAESGESSEEDYMNDDIVKKCEAAASSVTKSGRQISSLASASTVRQIAIHKKHVDSVAEARAEAKRMNARTRLEEGLSTAIAEDNVGFRLLSKMGFTPGSGLGPTKSGRAEPIPLEFRQGRSGLGREVIRSRLDAERSAARQRVIAMYRNSEQERQEQFSDLQKRRTADNRIRRDLFSARKACVDLDLKLDINRPFKEFYWPTGALPKKETEVATETSSPISSNEDEDEVEEVAVEEIAPSDQLEELAAYLRLQHVYCLWCGTVYENSDDLASNCPGPSAEFHDL